MNREKFHHDWQVNNLREKVAESIATRGMPYQKVYSALVAMDFFGNWEEEEFSIRPIDEQEVKDYVWEYWEQREPQKRRSLQEVYPFLFR